MRRYASQGQQSGDERMSASTRAAVVDFLFTGVGVVPLTLVIGGAPGLALMLACPLLIGACLCALYLEGPALDEPDGRGDPNGGERPPKDDQKDDHLVRRVVLPVHGQDAAETPFAARLAPAFAVAMRVARPAASSCRDVPALLRPKEAPAPDESPPATWLVPLDGTPEAMAAIDYVTTNARPERTRIHLLNVQPPVMASDVSPLASPAMIMRLRRTAGEEALQAARLELHAHGFQHTCDVVFGAPAEEIVRCAAQRGCAKIVMSARRTGWIANMLGRSVAARVLRRAPVPVTIVKAGQRTATSVRQRFGFA